VRSPSKYVNRIQRWSCVHQKCVRGCFRLTKAHGAGQGYLEGFQCGHVGVICSGSLLIRKETEMAKPSQFAIGRDITSFGRWVRVIFGLLLILYSGLRMISLTDRVDPLPLLGSFVAILVVYYAAYLVLEKPLLARMNPWLNALVFVVPSLVIVFVPAFPVVLRSGVVLYYGVTLVVNVLIGYGGCEVLAIPTLVYKRRYDVYCPTNVVDVAEQAIARNRGKPPQSEG
jgi:Family of unknown function (DUF6410)